MNAPVDAGEDIVTPAAIVPTVHHPRASRRHNRKNRTLLRLILYETLNAMMSPETLLKGRLNIDTNKWKTPHEQDAAKAGCRREKLHQYVNHESEQDTQGRKTQPEARDTKDAERLKRCRKAMASKVFSKGCLRKNEGELLENEWTQCTTCTTIV